MKYGNVCIAAHNYKNNTFFSNLSKLKNGDIIEITDLNGKTIKYEVYRIYKLKQDDLSCLSQNTNYLRIITLITCDNIDDSYRTIVKAKECF